MRKKNKKQHKEWFQYHSPPSPMHFMFVFYNGITHHEWVSFSLYLISVEFLLLTKTLQINSNQINTKNNDKFTNFSIFVSNKYYLYLVINSLTLSIQSARIYINSNNMNAHFICAWCGWCWIAQCLTLNWFI